MKLLGGTLNIEGRGMILLIFGFIVLISTITMYIALKNVWRDYKW